MLNYESQEKKIEVANMKTNINNMKPKPETTQNSLSRKIERILKNVSWKYQNLASSLPVLDKG